MNPCQTTKPRGGIVTITARGHPNIKASHENTLELTRDETVTQAGTCIIGVGGHWPEKDLLNLKGGVRITVRCGEAEDVLTARMNPTNILGDPFIIRRHPEPQPRSLCIGATKGSSALNRTLIAALRAPESQLEMVIEETGEHPPQGVLFVVATPIGDVRDLSPRASATLASVDLIAAEDTRTTRVLLGGGTPEMMALHDHNERERTHTVLDRLGRGEKVAIVSEAGTPLISDPGFVLVRAAAKAGHLVSPVPGPDALTSALTVAGLPTDDLRFIGFLPRKTGERRTTLQSLSQVNHSTVFFEAPHRVLETLAAIHEELGERPLALCRNLTKPGEEVLRGIPSELMNTLSTRDRVRGEFTVVVDRARDRVETKVDDALLTMAENLAKAGVPTKVIAQALSTATGRQRREMFQLVLKIKEHGGR